MTHPPRLATTRRRFLQTSAGLGVGLAALGSGAIGTASGTTAADGRLATAANLLANPGFEDVHDGRPVDWHPFNDASADLTESSSQLVRTGDHSVRVEDPSASTGVGLRSSNVPVVAGTLYTASLYTHNTAGRSDLYLEFWNSAGSRIGVKFSTNSAVDSWEQLRVSEYAPDGATHATVLLYLPADSVGVSYADDANLMAGSVDDSLIETFGTAAPTAAIVGFAGAGDTAYLVTRGQTPPKLVTVDLAARRVAKIVNLHRGDGGWATTISGGQVYAGTYPTPDLYRYDPQTAEVELLGTIGPDGGFVWCLTTAPDGVVYAGTYPRCEVWEYDPAAGSLRNLGVATDDVPYARTIAADEQYVYVGTTPRSHVIAIDRSTGERADIIPDAIPTDGAVGAILATGGRVLAAAGDVLVDMAPDGSDAVLIQAPNAPSSIDALTVTDDGVLYAAARRTGEIYRRVDDSLELVATPNPGDETRGIVLHDDGTLVGADGSGVLWYHDLDRGATELFDLTDTDAAGPDLVQSIAYDGAAVYVGGHFHITVHRPWDGDSHRIRVAGEPKALLPLGHGERLLAALYPSGELIDIDLRTDEVRSFGLLEHDQQRPWEMVFDAGSGLVLVASAASYGKLDGALTLLDPESGEMEVRTDLIPGQSLLSVAVADGVAYVAGDTYGGGSVDPVSPTAQVAAFDLATRTVLWRTEPLPDCPSLQHVEVLDGMLYGVYKRVSGTWFAMDLETREIRHQGTVSGYGEIVAYRGQVFAATNFSDDISRIGPDLDDDELLIGPIGTSWYTVPHLEFDRQWRAWGVSDRELARFDLHPRHRRRR